MRIYALAILAILGGAACQRDMQAPREAAAAARVDETDALLGEPEVIAENLNTVWAIDFLPDGRMIFTERPGRVSVADNGTRRTIGTIQVREQGEGGLHGIAVDPEFQQTRHIFAYYTHADANRVSRFTLGDDLAMGNEETVLDQIPRARFHNGGRIRFGPDGMLYIATGDAQNERLSQDRDSLAGKILRIRKDGSIPDDNPFGNAVWAYGLRNPQGIDWHPQTGELFVSSHGPRRRDEVNRIERGGNYGWPRPCDAWGDFIQAVRCFTEFTLAPCGIAFHNERLYIAGLRGRQVRMLQIEGSGVTQEEEPITDLGRVREVVIRDGWLYVGTSNRDGRSRPARSDDRILRYRLE
jgi:aldose sugar dehydrogenase